MKSDSAAIKKRYDRIAPYFEGLEAVMEGLFLKTGARNYGRKSMVITFLKSALEPEKTLIIILPMHALPRLILVRKCSSRPLIKRPGKYLC